MLTANSIDASTDSEGIFGNSGGIYTFPTGVVMDDTLDVAGLFEWGSVSTYSRQFPLFQGSVANPNTWTLTFTSGTQRRPFVVDIMLSCGTTASVNRWGAMTRRVIWRAPDTLGSNGIIMNDQNLGTASGSNVNFTIPTVTTNGFYIAAAPTTSTFALWALITVVGPDCTVTETVA